MDALALFGVFLKASALSLGGLSSLPLLRADLVAPGIATDDQVIQAIAIGRISTGPNGLYIVSLGYLVAGVVGATMALLAASLPPLVIVPITAAARRWLVATPVAGRARSRAGHSRPAGRHGDRNRHRHRDTFSMATRVGRDRRHADLSRDRASCDRHRDRRRSGA